MKLYNLLNSDASFSVSGEEHIDRVVFSTLSEKDMTRYIKHNKIILGKSLLYSNNYEYYTIVESELDISIITKGNK